MFSASLSVNGSVIVFPPGSLCARKGFANSALRLIFRFVYVRRHPALLELIAEFGAHEGARREARHAMEIFLANLSELFKILVLAFTGEIETVVVHDGIDVGPERVHDRVDMPFRRSMSSEDFTLSSEKLRNRI